MKPDKRHIQFYQNLKQELQNNFNMVCATKGRAIDLIRFDFSRHIEFYKVVTPKDKESLEIWLKNVKKRFSLLRYNAIYIAVFVDENYIEIERKSYKLNK